MKAEKVICDFKELEIKNCFQENSNKNELKIYKEKVL